jgi:hypothetical protein
MKPERGIAVREKPMHQLKLRRNVGNEPCERGDEKLRGKGCSHTCRVDFAEGPRHQSDDEEGSAQRATTRRATTQAHIAAPNTTRAKTPRHANRTRQQHEHVDCNATPAVQQDHRATPRSARTPPSQRRASHQTENVQGRGIEPQASRSITTQLKQPVNYPRRHQ